MLHPRRFTHKPPHTASQSHVIWVVFLGFFLGTQGDVRADGYDWPGKKSKYSLLIQSSRPDDRIQALTDATTFSAQDAQPLVERGLLDPVPRVRVAALDAVYDLRMVSMSNALRPLLSDPDVEVRVRAVRALGVLRDVQTLGELSRALSDSDAKVRAEAVRAVSRFSTPESRKVLVQALQDKNLDVVEAAMAGIRSSRDLGSLFAVVEKAQSNSSFLRRMAVETLGRLGDWRATEPVLARLYDVSPEVQQAALDALGHLGDPRATQDLVRFMRSHHQTPLGTRAAIALGRLGDPRATDVLLEAVRAQSTSSLAAIDALKTLGGAATTSKILRALQTSGEPQFQRACLEIVSFYASQPELPKKDARIMRRVFLREVDAGRLPLQSVVDVLANLGGREVVQRFDRLLREMHSDASRARHTEEERERVEWRIFTSFEQFGDPRVVPVLHERFPSAKTTQKVLILRALASIADGGSLSLVRSALKSSEPRVHDEALRVLMRLQTPEARAELFVLWKQGVGAFQVEAGEALAGSLTSAQRAELIAQARSLKHPMSHEALHVLAEGFRQSKGAHREVEAFLVETARQTTGVYRRSVALHALRAVPQERRGGVWGRLGLSGDLGSSDVVRGAIALGADWAQPEALDMVLKAAKHTSPAVRLEVAWALSAFQGEDVVGALVALTKDGDPDVVLNAAWSLSYQKADRAGVVRALRALLVHREDRVVANAVLSLKALGEPWTLEALGQLVRGRRTRSVAESVGHVLAHEKRDVEGWERVFGREWSARIGSVWSRVQSREIVDDGEMWVRTVLVDGERRLGGERVLFVLANGARLVQESDVGGELRVSRVVRGPVRRVALGSAFHRRGLRGEQQRMEDSNLWSGF